ncbi:MAG: ATP synthase F1 subunit gamma [Clostridiales bacterium]|nr:ATP synthase F1 subunit gamma [Candidatus Crickella equi]
MAESLQDIKRRIKSVTSTEHVTNAMKLVSTAKLRVAKGKYEAMNQNLLYVAKHISALFNVADNIPNEFLIENTDAEKTCYVVVTSSKGFCGGYNINVLKKVDELIAESDKEAAIVAIGSKGADYFKRNGRAEVICEYLDPPEEMDFNECVNLLAPALNRYQNGEFDKVVLVYTAFENVLSQVVRAHTMLPFSVEYTQMFANNDHDFIKQHSVDIEFLPNTTEFFAYLVIKYIQIDLCANVIEAATCEHTARRMAMENATDNANEMLDALSMSFNRARQAAITSEITEIVAGTEALT